MKKLLIASSFLSALALWALPAAADGPEQLQCRNLPARPGDAGDAAAKPPHQTRDCFEGDIWVLDGSNYACTAPDCQKACNPEAADGGQADCGSLLFICDATRRKCNKRVLNCTSDGVDPKAPNGCKKWKLEDGEVITKTETLLKAGGVDLSEYDQIVIWETDYVTSNGPQFKRFFGKNKVDGIGVRVPSKDPAPEHKFIGWVLAGTTKQVEDEINDAYFCAGTCAMPQGFANLLDTLTQVAAQLYVPYVHFKDATGGSGNDLTTKVQGENRAWNSFLDLKGDLFGGNNWRDNGNGTVEVAFPPPLRGVIPPFEGQIGLTLGPLDLYLMGLGPSSAVLPTKLYPVDVDSLIKPRPLGKPFLGFGVGMGIYPGVQIKPKLADVRTVAIEDVLAVEGQRSPSFEDAPHSIRQFWIAVTLPGITPDEQIVKADMSKLDGALVKLQRWRRAFNWYFYMMTHWRGRMITTFEGDVDDSPYWEFGMPADKLDDLKGIEVQGGLTIKGVQDIASPPVNNGALHVSTPGSEGKLVFSRGAFPIRIDANHFNAALVRMRIPVGAMDNGKAHASISFDGGPQNLQLPSSDAAALIPDGLWHTYSVNLSTAARWTAGGPYGKFTLSPSSLSADNLEIDFVRIISTENPEDKDVDCADDKTLKPDGWVDDFDNCPKRYNPGQEDGNGDGVGDACEDFDSDGVNNLCDNCPTFTNSRQRDTDKDGIGDNCDDSPGPTCCLTGNSIGGTTRPLRPGLFAGGAVFVLASLLLRRRRR